MELNTVLVQELIFAFVLFILTHYFVRNLLLGFNRRLPPGPKGWPILGCLPLLGDMPHVSLAKMVPRYGPVMFMKLGSCDVVIASKPSSARAFLKNLDQYFPNRPRIPAAIYVAYNAQDFVFLDHGARWKAYRKLSNLHMLGTKALGEWAPIRKAEIGLMIHGIYEMALGSKPVNLPEMLGCAMANMIGLVSINRRVFVSQGSESNEFKVMVVELMRLSGLFNIGDFIPSIAWMDLQGIQRRMKSIHKNFDALLVKMIEEHSSAAQERKGNPDFLDFVMESIGKSDDLELTITHVKALLQNLFVAGTDTSASTTEWALAEMLKKPRILRCAQAELDQVIGKSRRLEESDIQNLPYLQAIVKETLRLHPAAPLSLPRLSVEACEVDGYYIPKNTRLFVNVWAIGRDPEVWDNPLEFDPDRFFSQKYAKIEPWGNDFELIPFGSGRRICAGIKMAVALVGYMVGSLVHSFDWRLPKGVELNMDELFGVVLQKAVPLKTVASPRLHPSVYEGLRS